jgi:lipoprotein-releasing system permease protein
LITQLEKLVTLRFLKTRKKDGFLNVISIFSFIGISLGVAVLIIVMSVMNGFRSELINKIVGFNAHAVVKPYTKVLDLIYDNDFAHNILSNDGEAVILNKSNTKGILLKGYLENDFKDLEIVNNKEFIGSDNLNDNSISIGQQLSFNLNLDIGDTITIMSPSGVQTIVGSLPKQESFKIISIFDSGLSDYNENVAYVNLETLENFFDKKKDERFQEYYFKNPQKINDHKIGLMKLYPDELVYTWADMNKSLFSALKVERNVMFIILSLIIIVAAFNIISGLTILVKNKTRDIGILKSIGVQNFSIKKIFFLVGFIIGTSATLFGVIIGTLFSIYIENIREFISSLFNISLFPEEIYFLSIMPSEINIQSIFLIYICSIFTTIVVSIYPASKASKLDTVKTLKYE